MELRLEAHVQTTDGMGGTLADVVIDPVRKSVTHVVVRSELVSEELLLPLSLVQDTDHGELTLRVPAAQLPAMPRYYEGRSDEPANGRIDIVTPEGTSTLAGRQFVDGLAPGELE